MREGDILYCGFLITWQTLEKRVLTPRLQTAIRHSLSDTCIYIVCNRIRLDCGRKRRVVGNWDLPNRVAAYSCIR